MTEKYILKNGAIKDTTNDITFHDFIDILILINGQSRHLTELSEENEQLKSDVYDWKASAEDYLKLGKSLKNENEQLKQCHQDYIKLKRVTNDCKRENEQLKQQVQNIHKLINNKIDEFKNGDYGDLPCNTIHMFLDLKQELGDVE